MSAQNGPAGFDAGPDALVTAHPERGRDEANLGQRFSAGHGHPAVRAVPALVPHDFLSSLAHRS